ncbi:ABC transporter ATP-binding protein [Streptomyces abyssalis]|uniref:ABC transporter ATP-binding protein n=1 Tax=Streptomyces abyssalis TaxID=933944 RepID=A0A1E7JHW7_9ACTN|nr:ABC transporter ATP-binding protein [Streptomyces abyssalis]OEU86075.1 ABC transporter ATP-binding protein [Streptomyces abyssalis]OEU92459.1 ABC transporter ATP-binding protein [Streptomyces abyssalis]OEV06213.1 ABC transporter ATP-binding protein [Streptomyces nanshensis]
MNYDASALEATGLGMTYTRHRKAVLADCSFRLPQGRICALVGPNGAGKTTLLRLAAGLLRPTAGALTVLGRTPAEARERIAYVAQSKPLHPHLSVAGTLRYGAELNRRSGRWDQQAAERIAYGDGSIDPGAKIRTLSGGQRTRVALALAFGKRAELLLIDEPMADLDPLARQQLTGALMSSAVEDGTTIVMSSHVIPELEGTCDFLFLIADGRLRLGGGFEEVMAAHTLLTGAAAPGPGCGTVIEQRPAGRGCTALVRPDGDRPGDWLAERPTTEEVLLAHIRNTQAPPFLTESARPVPRQRQQSARPQENAA